MTKRFGFETRDSRGNWSEEAAGVQDASNTFATRAEAELELTSLAAALGCPVTEVRVVELDVAAS